MMAGLPKSGRWCAAVVLCVVSLSTFAQTLDPWLPLPEVEEQTSSVALQPLIDALGENPVATDAQLQSLLDAFASAIDGGWVTVDQGLAMLDLASWSTLLDALSVSTATDAMVSILSGRIDGTVLDPLLALADLLAAVVTPDGVRNAIERAGGSETLLAQVDTLVAAGLPPGVLVRLTQQTFHDGLEESDVVALFSDLSGVVDATAWGQIANDLLDQGNERQRDQEKNANANENGAAKDEEDSQQKNEQQESEQEAEKNEHGGGKGQGQSK
ncbi:MAG: hypothetical protein AB1778_05390 [Candidatus Bipolaricaulota bacterium]